MWLAGKNNSAASEELAGMEMSVSNCEHSAVFSSLPLVINWLRDRVQQNQSTRFQVKLINSYIFTLKIWEYLIRQSYVSY